MRCIADDCGETEIKGSMRPFLEVIFPSFVELSRVTFQPICVRFVYSDCGLVKHGRISTTEIFSGTVSTPSVAFQGCLRVSEGVSIDRMILNSKNET